MTTTQPVSVRLTEAQRAQLAGIARQRHIGASTLAALVVGDWLSRQAVPAEEQPAAKVRRLAADARGRLNLATGSEEAPDDIYVVTDYLVDCVGYIINAIDVLAGEPE